MSAIRFIHAADLHLASPFKGMYGLPADALQHIRESTFLAFQKLIEYALETRPDFVLLAGDIYDGEDRSLRAQLKFQEGMKKLEEAQIPVFVSYGNHDHLSGQWTRFDLPSNVYEFGEEVEKKTLQLTAGDVHIYGFSYPARHVREPMIGRYPMAQEREAFHIGMLHGSYAGEETHAVYAPFTKGELLAKQYDYWALGHIHLRSELHDNPSIIYPGNLQGRHRKERGEKGFYDVTLTKSETHLQFIPSSVIVFEQAVVNCTNIVHANEWLAACSEAIEECRNQYGACILDVKLTTINDETRSLFQQSLPEEWLDILREAEEVKTPFVWVHSLDWEDNPEMKQLPSKLTHSIAAEMDQWRAEDWKDMMKEVYQHTRIGKYLDIVNTHEIEDIKERAKKYLLLEMRE